jgi:hypothetical protein
MDATIFTILTNKKARKPGALAHLLDTNLQAGVPWFNVTL